MPFRDPNSMMNVWGDQQPIDLNRRLDFAPGEDDLSNKPPDTPSWNWASALRRNSEVFAYMASESVRTDNTPEDGFDPYALVKGTPDEVHWEKLSHTMNRRKFDAVLNDIKRETEDHRRLDSQPWWMGLITEGAASLLSPTTLLPGGALIKGARGGFTLARAALNTGVASGVATAAQEGLLHSIEQTRTIGESATAVGASVILGGLLGTGGQALLNKTELFRAVEGLNRSVDGFPAHVAGAPGDLPAGGSAWDNFVNGLEPKPKPGAWDTYINGVNGIDGKGSGTVAPAGADVPHPPPSLEDLTAAGGRGVQAVLKVSGGWNALLRLTQASPSAVVRENANKLMENVLYLKAHMEGRKVGTGAETEMQFWQGGLYEANAAMDKAFPQARKAGFKGSYQDFREEVGKAMRRDDVHENPFIQSIAKTWRDKVVEPMKQAAIKEGLLTPDVKVEEAASYFSRMWNTNKLVRQEPRVIEMFQRYFSDMIGTEFQTASKGLSTRNARLDQEIADLNLTPEARTQTLSQLDEAARQHESQWPSLSEAADRMAEIRNELRDARKTGTKADVERLSQEAQSIRDNFTGDSLQAFTKTRTDLRVRQRNVDFGMAGLATRHDRVLNQLADIEETNQRAMERLVSKGQKLERDLDRLDADALDERINSLAQQYSSIARKSEQAAERAKQAIENMKASAERGAERNRLTAEKAATEAVTGPAEEAAAKRATAKAASDAQQAKRAAADAKIQKRLEQEAEHHAARAKRMDEVGKRLETAAKFDHDGLMDEIKSAIDKATRETSAQSLRRGARAARLGERLADLTPDRIKARVNMLENMRIEAERKFADKWEIKNLGQGLGPGEKPDFSEVSKMVAREVFDHLTGRHTDGNVRPEFIKIGARGPLHERTFHIGDLYKHPESGTAVEDYLEHDVGKVMRRYTRIMGADIEIAAKFGDVNLTDQIKAIRDDYNKLREGVTDEKQLKSLSDFEERDVKDMGDMRDLLRGTYGLQNAGTNWAAISRAAKSLNYARSMGEVVLSSLTDAIRPAMVHGIVQFMTDLPKFVTNIQAVKMSIHEGRINGNILETVNHQRLGSITEITDPHSTVHPVQAFLDKMTDVASRWNGIRMWTEWMQAVTAVMTQNRILKNIQQDFSKLSKREQAYMAYLDIDAVKAGRMNELFKAHGQTIDGVHVAGTEKWSSGLAGVSPEEGYVLRRAYAAAVNKDVDTIIVQRGVGDVPTFVNTPTGSMLFQFKSFALASHQRVLLRGMQEDQARFVGGLISMTLMGMAITQLKAISGNRTDKLQKFSENPGWFVAEGLDRSGVFSVPMELSNMFEKATGVVGVKKADGTTATFNPLKAGITAFDKGGSMSQKNQNRSLIGALVGPTAGLVDDTLAAAGAGINLARGEPVTKGQKGSLERTIPYNSFIGMRQPIRYLLNPPENY